MFKLANTFQTSAGSPTGLQQGYPAIGVGAQTSGAAVPLPETIPWSPLVPIKGIFSWLFSSSASTQRGFPTPYDVRQKRPAGSMPNKPLIFGGVYQRYTPYYSRGAKAYVPNFGKVLQDPIGAGIFTPFRPLSSYGSSGQYANGQIFWANQVIPTTVNLTALSTPQELAALLSTLEIQAVVRTTG